MGAARLNADAGDSGDDGKSSDEDDIVAQLDADDERSRVLSLELEQPPKELARPPKKPKGSAIDRMEFIEDLKDKAAEEREIMRQEKAEQRENSRMTLEHRRQHLDLGRQKFDASQRIASIQEQTDLAMLSHNASIHRWVYLYLTTDPTEIPKI
ncbi:hypothetical protein BG011_003016 [Mortierella polycephala]|uniref:Uncharacterized protein n=1 Tax=Mortierella polycephala TaxID=41804 RepID=A0A9P6Q388_9FUNG|nr:hypothetical protein BG011_003016 [Mortierella polycephala]